MTVSATTIADQRLWLAPGVAANYGSCVDLWAPGTNILSASNESDTATMLRSGTSQAVPFVAGAAALYLQNATGEHQSSFSDRQSGLRTSPAERCALPAATLPCPALGHAPAARMLHPER